MTSQTETLHHLAMLLTTGEWRAAFLTAGYLIRHMEDRAVGEQLLNLLEPLTAQDHWTLDWQRMHAWAAYRAGKMDTLARLIDRLPADDVPGLRAAVAAERGQWDTVLQLWERFGEDAGRESWPEAEVLARFRARALAMQGSPRWQQAYAEAEQRTSSRRDQGLLLLDYGHYLSQAGSDQQARQALTKAGALLSKDPSLLRLCYANLGIVCLRLGDHLAAERFLKQAVTLAEQTDSQRYLSTAWRGLGGLYLRRQEWPRAAHAYAMAELKAQDVRQTVAARRSQARLQRFRGDLDQANMTIHQALMHLDWPSDTPHPLYVDLAEGLVLLKNLSAVDQLRPLFRVEQPSDAWRIEIVEAELARLRGNRPVLMHADWESEWWQEQAQLFPELLAECGFPASQAPEWSITVSADGPLHLRNVPLPTPVPVNHQALRLLAYLIHQGGSAGMERILEDLDIQGKTARLRRQNVSRLVGKLRSWLGWPESVRTNQHVLELSSDLSWNLIYPGPERADLFCEGCYDPWILAWRLEHMEINFPDFQSS